MTFCLDLHARRFTYLSPAIEELTGHPLGFFLDNLEETARRVVHPDDAPALERALRRTAEKGPDEQTSLSCRLVRADGEEVPVKLVVEFGFDGRRAQTMHGQLHPVEQDELRLIQRLLLEQAVAECGRALSRPDDLHSALAALTDTLLNATGTSRVFVLESFDDPDLGRCMRPAAESVAPRTASVADNPRFARLAFSEAPPSIGRSILRGRPFRAIVRDLRAPDRRLIGPGDAKSVLMLPIVVEGEVEGALGFDDCVSERAWSRQDVNLLTSVAEMIAGAIGRRRIEERQRLLHALSLRLSAAATLEEALPACVDCALKLSGIEMGGLYLKDESSGGLYLAFKSNLPDEVSEIIARCGADSQVARAVMLGEPIYARCVEPDPSHGDKLTKAGMLACASIPIRSDDTVIACLNVGTRLHKDVPVASRGALEAAAAQMANAIARLRAEARLKQVLEERYKALSDNVPVGVFRSTRDGELLSANPALVRMLGYGSFEELRRAFPSAVYADPDVRRNFVRGAGTDGSATDLEVKLRRKDGELVWASISSRASVAADGTVYFDGVLRDVTDRRLAEHALRDSEEMYRTTIDSLGDIVHVMDTDLKIVMMNRSYEGWSRRLGLTPDPVGKRMFEVFPFLPERVLDEYRSVIESGKPLYTDEATAVGDEEYITETRKIPILEGGRVARVVTAVRDVTAQRRSEAALRSSESLNRNLVEHSPLGIVYLDAEGRVIYENPAFARMTGAPDGAPTDAIGLRLDAVPGIADVRLHEAVERVLSGEEVSATAVHCRSPLGVERDIEVSGAPTFDESGRVAGAVFLVADVSERARAEAELARSLDHYQKLFVESPVGILVCDTEGRIQDVNPQMVRMLGSPGKEATKAFNMLTFGPLVETGLSSALRRCIDEAATVDYEFMYTSHWGVTRDYHVRMVPLRGRPGDVSGALVISEDVTQSKHADRIRAVMSEITEATAVSGDLSELLGTIHRLLWRLMDASNFYVALFEEESGIYTFPYHADEREGTYQFTSARLTGSLTDYVRQTGEPLYADAETLETLRRSDKAYMMGERSAIWIGAPLRTDRGTIGVVAVQHYTNPRALTRDDLSVLSQVSGHIATAIERKRIADALRESESRYRTLVETFHDVVYITDHAGRMLYANKALKEQTGFTVADFQHSLEESPYVHPDDRARVAEFVAKFAASDERYSPAIENRFFDAHGRERWHSSAVSKVDYEGRPALQFITRDITSRKTAEMTISRERKAYRIIAEAASIPNLPEMCARVLASVDEEMRFGLGMVRLLDRKTGLLNAVALVDADRSSTLAGAIPRHIDDPDYLVSGVARTKTGVFAPDVSRHDVSRAHGERLKEIGISALICWPLVDSSGETLGIIQFASRTPREVSEGDREFFEMVAGLFGTVIERKRAEEALRESEAKYRDLVENTFDIIYTLDAGGRLREVNESFLRLGGYAQSEVIGREFRSLVHREDEALADESLDAVRRGEPRETEMRAIRKDGSFGWYSFFNRPVFDSEGGLDAIRGIARDVTDRKAAEHSFRQHHSYTEMLSDVSTLLLRADDPLDAMDDVVSYIGRTSGADRCDFYVIRPGDNGDALASLHAEWAAEGIEPASHVPGFVATDVPLVSSGLGQILSEITTKDAVEVDVPSLPESVRPLAQALGDRSVLLLPVRSGNKLMGLVTLAECRSTRTWDRDEIGILRAVAAALSSAFVRAGTALALSESESRFRDLFDKSPICMIEAAIVDGAPVIIDANRKAEELYGYSQREFRGMRFRRLVPPEGRPRFDDEISAIAEVHSQTFESHGRDRDGRVFPVRVSASTSLVANELRLVMTIEDMSAELKMRERLVEQQKEESITMLAAGVAHDFNNILVGVLGGAELLRHEIAPYGVGVKHCDMIASAARRLSELTAQLLAYARGGKFHPQIVDPNAAVRETLAMMHGIMRPDIAVAARLDSTWNIEADPSQLHQVLLNVVLNALEAMEHGGTMTISTDDEHVEEWESPQPDAPPAGDYVHVAVEDTGTGMNDHTMRRMFDPFFSTKAIGRGLGLAAVIGIVKNHGGRVRVESEQRAGTTFHLYLPRTAVRKPSRGPTTETRERGPATILLVDDEEVVLEVTEMHLHNAGHTVVTTQNGEAAIRVFAERPDSFDLVLLDMKLPDKSGALVFEELIAVRPDVRVILSSGYNEDEALAGIKRRELIAGFLKKPYSEEALLEAVRAAFTEESSGG